MENLNTYDGKYLFVADSGLIKILQNGNEWKSFKHDGDVIDLVLLLVQEIIDLQEIINEMEFADELEYENKLGWDI